MNARPRVAIGALVAFVAIALLAGCTSPKRAYCAAALAERQRLEEGMVFRFGPRDVAAERLAADRFRAQCEALPVEAAHCAVPSYAHAHRTCWQRYAGQLRALPLAQ